MANTKLAGMKSLLLRAWRERWPDVQWSINVKKLLPQTSATSDNSQLADLLLSQALIGSSPNNLVLSYLKHAMCTQMVPCAAVIRSIVQYEDISKPYCMRSLLDVVAEFAGRVSLKGTSEDSLTLAQALLSLIKWLTDIIQRSVQRYSEDRTAMEYQTLIDRSCDLLRVLIETPASCALLYIARLEDPDLYTEIEQTSTTILALPQSANINTNVRDKLEASLRLLSRVESHTTPPSPMMDVTRQTLNISINVLLNIEAVLNPTNNVQSFVEQLLVIEQVQGLKRSDLYCELLRTCLLGSIDAAIGKGEEINWAAFAFLKLPQALVELMAASQDTNKQQHLEQAFDKLLQFAALLNLADSKCKCDWLSTLLNELTKYSLLPETTVNAIIQKRQSDTSKPRPQEVLAAHQPSPTLILRAEPTVNSILKFNQTLDADYSKNQDALLGVLCHMLSGKSFALILTAAAARGKLHSFAEKLIKFNEFAKQTPGKSAQTSALLFDITFLMLCHIVQEYGIDVIMSSGESTDSFFVQWATHCLPDENKYRSLDLHPFKDQAKVDLLLQQFNAGGEIKANPLRWHEVCQNIPHAVYEVLIAWEYGVLSADQVKGILDNVKGRMCCLPVVVSTWFCTYIYTIDDEHRKKPLNILSQLSKPVLPDPSNQYYHERSHLMVAILTKMVQEVVPHKGTRTTPSTVLPRTQPARTMLLETYQSVFSNSCINTKDIQKFEHLLNVAGPRWFCEQLVREVLSQSRVEDINKGVSLVFSLFHLDLESLTLCLLHHVLPSMLHGSGNNLTLLTDPRGRALAQLSVMCLLTTHKMRSTQKDSQNIKKRDSRKRSRTDVELEDADGFGEDFQPSKLRRMASSDESGSMQYEGFNLGELLGSEKKAEPVPAYDTKDPLNKALVNLLSLFLHIVSCSQVSQKTGFVIAFIEETVKAGPETSKFVLNFMPLTLVSQLMKCSPPHFNAELLLSVSDLATTMGRKVAAKVICQNARYTKVTSHQSQD